MCLSDIPVIIKNRSLSKGFSIPLYIHCIVEIGAIASTDGWKAIHRSVNILFIYRWPKAINYKAFKSPPR